MWFNELEYQVGNLGGVEHYENKRLANLSSAILAKGSGKGKPPMLLLGENDEYQKLFKVVKEQIDSANRQLEVLRPKLESAKAALESVGC